VYVTLITILASRQVYFEPTKDHPVGATFEPTKDKPATHINNEELCQNSLSQEIIDRIPGEMQRLFPLNKTYIDDVQTELKNVDIQQKRRLQQLHKFCSSSQYEEMKAKGRVWTGSVITVIDDYHAFECRVPKTGTYTRAEIMWPLFHTSPPRTSPPLHPVYDGQVPKTTALKISKSIGNHSSRFMFTRDPFERAVSGYFDKVVENSAHWFGQKEATMVSYFTKLSQQFNGNEHFMMQVKICDPCLLKMTFLGRAETMNRDLDYLINNATSMNEKIKFKYNPNHPVGSTHANKSKFNASIFTNLTLDVVLDFLWMYRFDYLAFGYNPYCSLKRFQDIKSTL